MNIYVPKLKYFDTNDCPQVVGEPRQHMAKRSVRGEGGQNTPSQHTLSVAEQEGVEPIDYEEFVSQQSERDPLGWVLEFPEDDIEVNLVPRKIRTEEHVVPEEPYAQVLDWTEHPV